MFTQGNNEFVQLACKTVEIRAYVFAEDLASVWLNLKGLPLHVTPHKTRQLIVLKFGRFEDDSSLLNLLRHIGAPVERAVLVA